MTISTIKQAILNKPLLTGLLLAAVVAAGLLATAGLARAALANDEGRIAFVVDGDIYTMNDDGAEQTRLTDSPAEDSGPAWSPDGTKMAFVRSQDGNDEVYMMNADGSDQARLTEDPAEYSGPAWSPDSEKITFASTRDGNREIYTISVDGSGTSRLTDDPAEDSDPSWSPDGTKIAFSSSRNSDGNDYVTDIYTMNPDGSGLEKLTDSSANDPNGVYVYFANSPDWSPNGEEIVFQSGVYNPRFHTYIDVIKADGSGEPKRLATSDHSDSSPTWSPDGKKVAFSQKARYPEYPADADIYVVNSDGSELANLTDTPTDEDSPDWGSAPNTQSPSDTTPPDTTLETLSSPSSGATRDRSASLFFSSEPRTTFECSLDGAEFSPCGAGKSSYSQESYYDLPDGKHTFQVRATDQAGNTDPTPESRVWTVDNAAPKGAVLIDNGARSTKKAAVKLALSVRDPQPGSGVESMRFSNNGSTWSAWEPYAKSKTWTLGSGKGTKTVYVEYRDKAGNISAVATDTINKTR